VAERRQCAGLHDRDGQPEPDADLRDTETVPLEKSIDAYFKREVLPHVPDAPHCSSIPSRITSTSSLNCPERYRSAKPWRR
jgi:hypothetical protein